jgi:xanthine dehydrogenase accessory factor
LIASLPASEGWTEPLGESGRAVYLFDADHVGRALAPLPFAVRWIDSRREAFPAYAANVALIHAAEPTKELANAPDGALIVVMTHSHAIDLEIVADALRMDRVRLCRPHRVGDEAGALPEPDACRRLVRERLSKLVCPIGLAGVKGKDPAVIAAFGGRASVDDKRAAERGRRKAQT